VIDAPGDPARRSTSMGRELWRLRGVSGREVRCVLRELRDPHRVVDGAVGLDRLVADARRRFPKARFRLNLASPFETSM
jgi:hypothetical protein